MDRRTIFVYLIPAVGLCLLASCMDSFYDYGRLNPSRQAGAVFEEGEVLGGYQYFISGSEGDPDAVIAIAPGFKLSSRNWTPATPDKNKLRQWTSLMGRDLERQPYLRGAVLEDFKGNAVGYWYSPYPRTMVRVRDKDVEVGPPQANSEQ